MSNASSPADPRTESWVERRQHWIAAVASALVHVLFLLLALWSSQLTVTQPQGSAAGSRVVVDFIGDTPPQPIPAPVAKKPASKPAKKAPAKSRTQTTLVARAEDPLPADAPDATTQDDAQALSDSAQDIAQAPPASPPPTRPRTPHIWGQPPGMMQEDMAPENAGMARSASTQSGRRNDASSGPPSMEVGGYQVYYDLRSDARLRAWREKGMTEIFLPLPGTRRYMVCPLETALRRESGPCRLLEPDDPELAKIGDAREAIDMQQVYRLGELVWRGPGPYR